MKGFIARTFITAFGLWIADTLLPGIRFDGVVSLWLSALLLGVVNAVVRPLVVLLTLPITFLSLGLFILVINGLMLMMVAAFVSSFHIAGLGSPLPGDGFRVRFRPRPTATPNPNPTPEG